MNTYAIIKRLLQIRDRRMMEVVEGMGVTLQSVNRSLHGNITLERFCKMVKLAGGEVGVVWTDEAGRTRYKTLEQLEEEWVK